MGSTDPDDRADGQADGSPPPEGPLHDLTNDDGDPICGVLKQSASGRCHHIVPNGICPIHGDRDARWEALTGGEVQLPEGIGGKGQTLPSKGHGLNKARPGNKNAMTHGFHAIRDDPVGTLDWLEENEPDAYDYISRKFWSYLERCSFDETSALADDILMATMMLYATRNALDGQVIEGLTLRQPVQGADGQFHEQLIGHPRNLEANRMRREARSILKEYGLLDDPESKKADAMSDWGAAAQEIARMEDSEDDVIDVDSMATDGGDLP